MKIVAIVQARMGSTRLPNKVMRLIGGAPLIERLLVRLSRSRRIDEIVLATSTDPRNEPLVEHVCKLGYAVFRGSEEDVLDRYYQAAKWRQADVIVRITGDCPLVDPELVDQVITGYEEQGVDYFSNIDPPTYPDGLDTEVFSFETLERTARLATEPGEREHVTPFMRKSGLFMTGNLVNEEDCSQERWTVDETEDLWVVDALFAHFHPRVDFGWREVLAVIRSRQDLRAINQHLRRNRGLLT